MEASELGIRPLVSGAADPGAATPAGFLPSQARPAGRRLAHTRRIATVTAGVWLATAAGVLLEPLAPGLAPGGRPHPTLEPTFPAAAGILATNLRVLAAPYLLAAFRWPNSSRARTLGDVIIAAVVLENTITVGLAVGHYGAQLIPYLPQLPLEWAALAASVAAWITARADPRARALVAYAAATLTLAIAAASCEVLLTPHAH
jgi:hypothetical protein